MARAKTAQSHVMRNYVAKAERSVTPSNKVLTFPNLITACRTIPCVIALHLLYEGKVAPAVVIGALFVALDVADGFVARALDQVSRVGQIGDVVLDKTALIGTVIVADLRGWLPTWLTLGVGMRIAVIAVLAYLLDRREIRRPTNGWSIPANLSVAAVAIWMSPITLGIAAALNAHNAVHYVHYATSMLVRRIEAARVS